MSKETKMIKYKFEFPETELDRFIKEVSLRDVVDHVHETEDDEGYTEELDGKSGVEEKKRG